MWTWLLQSGFNNAEAIHIYLVYSAERGASLHKHTFFQLGFSFWKIIDASIMAAVTMLLFHSFQQTCWRRRHSPSFFTHNWSEEFLKESLSTMNVWSRRTFFQIGCRFYGYIHINRHTKSCWKHRWDEESGHAGHDFSLCMKWKIALIFTFRRFNTSRTRNQLSVDVDLSCGGGGGCLCYGCVPRQRVFGT